ncbi:unnamed protein product [Meganyctiphanes norvegica]|uniref:Integrase catalytic domain-containing protein n=1 Tax=Meganyctiphanes norvegica TaxID=48144 RepID=A0AAV2S172_MEGNR
MRRRVFMQKLWIRNLKWDENFEFIENLKEQWLHLVSETHISVTSTFPRNAKLTQKSEVHIFSDASKDSYGTVVYVKTPICEEYPNGNIHLSCAKGKVAPIEGKQTIPRLELSGALLAAHKVPYMMKAWDLPVDTKFIFWCDARVVLTWLSQYNIKEIYVHNRVKQIRDLCNNQNVKILHVPTDLNPADMITKDQKATKFVESTVWWNGPWWLQEEKNWPEQEILYNLYPEGVETLGEAIQCKTSHILATVAIDIGKTSLLGFFKLYSFETGLRVMAYILRAFRHKARKFDTKLQEFNRDQVTKNAMDEAKDTAIRIMQEDMFGEELHHLKRGQVITKGPCRKWNLFLDTAGIIRCRGRLANLSEPKIKNDPILVHGKHPLIASFITYKHRHSNCSSRQYTLHKVRKEMHGPGLTAAVNNVVRSCNTCRILRARPYGYPPAPPLPKERLAAERPFAVCGVDYSGPHQVKHGRGTKKVWIALFTCMVSRAIYLMAVPDLSAQTFLQTLQSLAWTVGTPKVILSDNATNFTGTLKLLKEIKSQKRVQDTLALKGIEWKFTPPYAPWFGAVYERMIGTLKKELIKLIGHRMLTHFELTTQLAEIQGVINNRPLVQVGSEDVLTPNNILTGRDDSNDDIFNVLDTTQILDEALSASKDLPKLFTQTAKRRSTFWRKFQEQYLESIKFSNDVPGTVNRGLKPKEGDLVIIHSHDPRLKWRKAVIITPIMSDDGQCRKCLVKTSTGQTIRATKHLHPLEINVEEYIDITRERRVAESNDFEGFEEQVPTARTLRALKLQKYLAEQHQSDESS